MADEIENEINKLTREYIMKKLLFLILVIFFLFDYGFSQTGDILISDSVKYENSLIEKIFPGVDFWNQISHITAPPNRRVVGKYNGKIYYIPNLYNELLKEFEGKSSTSLQEKMEAFFVLTNVALGDTIESFKLTEASELLDGRKFNYKASYVKDGQKYSILLIIEKSQLKEYRIFLGDKFIGSGHFFII